MKPDTRKKSIPDAPVRIPTGADSATSVSPPPPSKSTARLLWACFSAFIVYGTTFPFRFNIGWHTFLAATSRINWLPLGGGQGNPNVSDIIQNVLLFMPFGFLGYFSIVYKSSLLKKAAVVVMGASLSVSVEFLQIFSVTRYPALSDVEFNTLGTAVGLAAAVWLKRSVLGFKTNPAARRFLDAESAFPAFIFFTLAVAGCWQPFDFGMDIGSIWGHFQPMFQDPFRFTSLDDDLINFIRFLLATLFLCRMAGEAGLRRPALLGSLFMGLLGIALEASQVFVQSRGPEIQDALVNVAGALGGGFLFFFPGFHHRPRTWTVAGGLTIFFSAAARALYPYRFNMHFSGINLMLFRSPYAGGAFTALCNFTENAMVFFPMGFLLAYFLPKRRPTAMAALIAGAMALVVELLQGFAPGRYPDVTDVLGAMLGGVAGGMTLTRGWPAFRAYMARDDDRQV